jgi:hypothetical protein
MAEKKGAITMNPNRQPGRRRPVPTPCPLATVRLARRVDGIAVTLRANAAAGSRVADQGAERRNRGTAAWRMRGGRLAATVAAPYHPPRRRSMPAPLRHP